MSEIKRPNPDETSEFSGPRVSDEVKLTISEVLKITPITPIPEELAYLSEEAKSSLRLLGRILVANITLRTDIIHQPREPFVQEIILPPGVNYEEMNIWLASLGFTLISSIELETNESSKKWSVTMSLTSGEA